MTTAQQYASTHKKTAAHLELVCFHRGWRPGTEQPEGDVAAAFDTIPQPVSVESYAITTKRSSGHVDAVCRANNWLPESASSVDVLEQVFGQIEDPEPAE
jgi:hypothetical protein